jgi:hypothetical protein
MAHGRIELRGRAFAATFFAGAAAVSCSGAQGSPLLGGEAGTDGEVVDTGTVDAAKETGPAEAAPPADVPPVPGIPCGDAVCTLGSQTCCREGSSAPYTLQCTSSSACTGLSIPCADTADCTAGGHPGDVCCGQFDKDDLVVEVGCVAPTECQYTDYRVILCSLSGSDPCPSGETCQTSSLTLRGFNLCLKPGG